MPSAKLSARLALSSISLTRAKRDVEIRKPFLSLIYTELKGEENGSLLRGLKSVNFREHRAKQGAKFSSFQEISEFLRDCEIPRGGGDIPAPL